MHQTKTGITKEKWGVIDNKQAWLFTLTNEKGSKFRCSNYGCIVQALQVKNRQGILTDVVLGYDEVSSYTTDNFYMGGVVGRCANRIGGSTLEIGAATINLTQNRDGFHHHGGREGFNKKMWEVAEEGSSNIKFYYKSADGEEGYPGTLEIWVNYLFEEDDRWTVEYEAIADRTTLINVTQHAYFNLGGHSTGSIENHDLTVYAKEYLTVNKLQMPTGEMAKVGFTPFDFRQPQKINLRINDAHEQLVLSGGYDHSWVLERTSTARWKRAAALHSHLTGIALNVFTTEPSIHVYTGNFLEKTSGKDDSVYGRRSGLCLETQHFPDAPHHYQFPSIVLEAGNIFRSKTAFQFSIL